MTNTMLKPGWEDHSGSGSNYAHMIMVETYHQGHRVYTLLNTLDDLKVIVESLGSPALKELQQVWSVPRGYPAIYNHSIHYIPGLRVEIRLASRNMTISKELVNPYQRWYLDKTNLWLTWPSPIYTQAVQQACKLFDCISLFWPIPAYD